LPIGSFFSENIPLDDGFLRIRSVSDAKPVNLRALAVLSRQIASNYRYGITGCFMRSA